MKIRKTELSSDTKLRGPAVFLGQFFNEDDDRFNSLEACAKSAADAGMKGLELPLWCGGLIDFDKAVGSKQYCEDLQAVATGQGCPIIRVTNHLDWQNVAATLAMEPLYRGLCPDGTAGDCNAQRKWSQGRVRGSFKIAKHFGMNSVGGFPGHHAATHLSYPWIPEPKGLFYAARADHGKQWKPLLDEADDMGLDVCWEVHPQQATVSGADFARYLPHVGDHKRLKKLLDLSHPVLQAIPKKLLVQIIKFWGEQDRIGQAHIKEALCNPTHMAGTLDYGPFVEKPARFRGLGDGQIGYVEEVEALDALGILIWLVYEWEDCGDDNGKTKGKVQALEEGAAYISALLNGTELPGKTEPIPHSDSGFEDFADVSAAKLVAQLAEITGLPANEIEIDPSINLK